MPANAGDTRNEGPIPGWGRSPGEGNGYPLQYSCLGNPMEEPGVLQFMGPQRVRLSMHTHSSQPFLQVLLHQNLSQSVHIQFTHQLQNKEQNKYGHTETYKERNKKILSSISVLNHSSSFYLSLLYKMHNFFKCIIFKRCIVQKQQGDALLVS